MEKYLIRPLAHFKNQRISFLCSSVVGVAYIFKIVTPHQKHHLQNLLLFHRLPFKLKIIWILLKMTLKFPQNVTTVGIIAYWALPRNRDFSDVFGVVL